MKILFVNPKRENLNGIDAHNGLALLGTILKDKCHEVKILDYMIIQEDISLKDFIEDFNPDMIGVSVYTINRDACFDKIREIRRYFNGILIVGGHHPSYKLEDFKGLDIDYIIVGEAEKSILGVEYMIRQKQTKIIFGKPLEDLNDLPFPDYRLFYNDLPFPDYRLFYKCENIYNYPIAIFQTANEKLKLRHLNKIFAVAISYNILGDFFIWLPKGIIKSLKKKFSMLKSAITYTKTNGLKSLINRINYLIKARRID